MLGKEGGRRKKHLTCLSFFSRVLKGPSRNKLNSNNIDSERIEMSTSSPHNILVPLVHADRVNCELGIIAQFSGSLSQEITM